MADGDPLHTLPDAVIRGYRNEVAIDQRSGGNNHPTFDDPIKARLGSWEPADQRANFYLGAISFDLLRGDENHPIRYEKGFIAFKLDPDPTVEIFLQDSANTTDDSTMRRKIRITPDRIECDIPITAPNINAGGAGGSVLRSPDGRLQLVAQGDQNLVLYLDGIPIRALFGLGPDRTW